MFQNIALFNLFSSKTRGKSSVPQEPDITFVCDVADELKEEVGTGKEVAEEKRIEEEELSEEKEEEEEDKTEEEMEEEMEEEEEEEEKVSSSDRAS